MSTGHQFLKFCKYCIRFCKEEWNTSYINQCYDQTITNANKRYIFEALSYYHFQTIDVADRFKLNCICCHALEKVKPKAWIKLFKKIMSHVDFCVTFVERTKHIDASL